MSTFDKTYRLLYLCLVGSFRTNKFSKKSTIYFFRPQRLIAYCMLLSHWNLIMRQIRKLTSRLIQLRMAQLLKTHPFLLKTTTDKLSGLVKCKDHCSVSLMTIIVSWRN